MGGGAVRAFDPYQDLLLYVANSTLGGRAGFGNSCSNSGALSSIGESWTVLNSVFSYNTAIGNGTNRAAAGTPGGGSGGAVYRDGDLFDLVVDGTLIDESSANEGGGAVFFVSNSLTGTLRIEDSTLVNNPSTGFETPGYPGIFYLGSGDPVVIDCTLF